MADEAKAWSDEWIDALWDEVDGTSECSASPCMHLRAWARAVAAKAMEEAADLDAEVTYLPPDLQSPEASSAWAIGWTDGVNAMEAAILARAKEIANE